MKRFRFLSILAIAMVTLPLMAQSEAGTILELGVEKKLSKAIPSFSHRSVTSESITSVTAFPVFTLGCNRSKFSPSSLI